MGRSRERYDGVSAILKFLIPGLLIVGVCCFTPGARAWHDPGPPGYRDGANRMMITDGSCVMNIGELQINITNHGLIGSQFSIVSSYSDAPSAQWPSSSGNEYLFAAGLWVGGIKNGEAHVSTGQYESELRPLTGPEHTIYEAKFGKITRPRSRGSFQGARRFELGADDDDDGRMNEEILNGLDDDRDGAVDEDFEMYGNQMMVCTMYDNTPISTELFPDHEPLDIEVVQTSFCWDTDEYDDFVVIRHDIRNVGATRIEDVYLGMFVDSDIGPRDSGGVAFDDLPARFTGMARATNGIYENIDVAYMFDANKNAPLPGYFGVMFRSRRGNSIHSYQTYTGRQAYALGGDPLNDAERYNDLSRESSDPSRAPDHSGDYRFLVSNGPWGNLYPGQRISLETVFVVGEGLEGLLENCANAQQAWEGVWYDLDRDPLTGRFGQETLVCLEDLGFDLSTFPASPMPDWTAAYADYSCLPEDAIRPIAIHDLFEMSDERHCIWVNFDNCDECMNIRGQPCSKSVFFNYWNCGLAYLPVDQRPCCTGIAGRESVVRWLVETTPQPPTMRVWAEDFVVHVYWNDDSEFKSDIVSGHIDFEGYQVWRADGWDRPPGTNESTGPATDLWTLISQYDLVNEFVDIYHHTQGVDTRIHPLGENTGLGVAEYRPSCLDDARFEGLETAMLISLSENIGVDPDVRPRVRKTDGNVRPGMEYLVPWEAYPAVLDSFYWCLPWEGGAETGTAPKRAKHFYEYIDRDVHNGFLYFYSVTTSDHQMVESYWGTYLTGPGQRGDPSVQFAAARPGTPSQTAESRLYDGPRIFVYPNPATREALADYQPFFPNSDDPTGVRVTFANLPAARNTVSIYTLNGDLVQTLQHDGTTGRGDVSWNLVSRNGQEVVSGIYLYSVTSDLPQFGDFVDKFVIVR